MRTVPAECLTVVVNTADDEEFFGLHVSPDLDTIAYTLAGRAPMFPGWGIEGDTFGALEELSRLYGRDWFALGDHDLATHVFRTDMLRQGLGLTEVTRRICDSFDIGVRVLPMTDAKVRTVVDTRVGRLPFQDWLVKRRARLRVEHVRFVGVAKAVPTPEALAAVADATHVIIAPSNPYVSIGPMLAMTPFRRALAEARPRVTAVSPLIGGRAVKGPLAAMLRSLGPAPGLPGIAGYYARYAGRLVVAPGDTPGRPEPGWPEIVEHEILLTDPAAAERLARFLLEP